MKAMAAMKAPKAMKAIKALKIMEASKTLALKTAGAYSSVAQNTKTVKAMKASKAMQAVKASNTWAMTTAGAYRSDAKSTRLKPKDVKMWPIAMLMKAMSATKSMKVQQPKTEVAWRYKEKVWSC